MKSFKNHLSLIFALIVMMFAFEFLIITNKTIEHYENLVNKDYNIIVVSKTILDKNNIQKQVKEFKSIDTLDPSLMLDRLKNDISQKNLEVLKATLPKFYTLKLDRLLSYKELEDLKEKLLQNSNILKVETFAKTHTKIYKLLVLVKFLLWFFLFIIILLSFVLLFKQMKIWFFEHTQRIEIMCLFGAPFWFRSLMLYKVILIDCLIAFLILLLFFTQLYDLQSIKITLQSVDINLPKINIFANLFLIFIIMLVLCFLCVSFVMLRVRK
ncbi:FtsX-like permease family protein [Campylobacter insulaenigrae]|uniref:FtsX-like permease family protein n=1 Tax=Campylobacter insulaenigrae TaxID=260714 RepID=UPI0021529BF8|nr:FtsX-like permease family protein [Campylobacter insulaenigrae]MCR6578373.1 ABC transporter permease [Campylobacter insulaenigrae]MCR6585650.1 ABC transporter permease [Campylobacter insulaenigrae]